MTVPSAVIKAARKSALRSSYRFRLGAVIYRKNVILGVGVNNHLKTHPKSSTFHNRTHAELAAIISVPEGKLKGASIYVHRLRRDGLDGISRPCKHCMRLLMSVGIKDINYSVNPHWILSNRQGEMK